MAPFIPGKATSKRRRAAMQAALYVARHNRLDKLTVKHVYSTLTGETNGTLSTDKLTYTANGTAASSGAKSNTAKTTGKWYFEVTLTNLQTGGQTGIALADIAATYADMGSSLATKGIVEYLNTGDVYANGSQKGNANGGQRVPHTSDVIGVSVDVDNHEVWYQNLTTGGTRQGPFAAVAEASYEAMITTNATTGTNGVFTFNFGETAFTGTVPTGFTAWG